MPAAMVVGVSVVCEEGVRVVCAGACARVIELLVNACACVTALLASACGAVWVGASAGATAPPLASTGDELAVLLCGGCVRKRCRKKININTSESQKR